MRMASRRLAPLASRDWSAIVRSETADSTAGTTYVLVAVDMLFEESVEVGVDVTENAGGVLQPIVNVVIGSEDELARSDVELGDDKLMADQPDDSESELDAVAAAVGRPVLEAAALVIVDNEA